MTTEASYEGNSTSVNYNAMGVRSSMELFTPAMDVGEKICILAKGTHCQHVSSPLGLG